MKKRLAVTLFAAGCMAVAVSGCGNQKEQAAEEVNVQNTEAEETADQTEGSGEVISLDASILVQGYEWGPGVPKIVLDLGQEVSELNVGECTVTTAEVERTVTDVYLCDAQGERTDEASGYAAIEMETTSEVSGSPFIYDRTVKMNKWSEKYEVTVDCPDFLMDGNAAELMVEQDCIAERICPDTDMFAYRDSFTGTYSNSLTGEEDELTLHMAAFEPETIKDGEKNPLLIWLHGQGEGGTDPDIAILGNEVSALAKEEIQSRFISGDESAAYVLVVQCETYWMDEGDGTNGKGSGISKYTDILMDTIKSYVDSNPDIDARRIYLGGCSNGGYMTMNMIISHPNYFAAAYPCCEAYAFYEFERNENGSYHTGEDDGTGTPVVAMTDKRWMSEEKISDLKDFPLWFVISADDPIVDPGKYVFPTYQALVKAGAENAWLSVFENVKGTDSPETMYVGHFSWIYLLNNQVTKVQDKEAIISAENQETYGITPNNDGGGSLSVGEYSDLFDWLNAQKKQG